MKGQSSNLVWVWTSKISLPWGVDIISPNASSIVELFKPTTIKFEIIFNIIIPCSHFHFIKRFAKERIWIGWVTWITNCLISLLLTAIAVNISRSRRSLSITLSSNSDLRSSSGCLGGSLFSSADDLFFSSSVFPSSFSFLLIFCRLLNYNFYIMPKKKNSKNKKELVILSNLKLILYYCISIITLMHTFPSFQK